MVPGNGKRQEVAQDSMAGDCVLCPSGGMINSDGRFCLVGVGRSRRPKVGLECMGVLPEIVPIPCEPAPILCSEWRCELRCEISHGVQVVLQGLRASAVVALSWNEMRERFLTLPWR